MKANIESPLQALVVSPFQRAIELPLWAKALAAVVGTWATWVWSDAFFGALLVLLVSSGADWAVGKRAAKARRGPPEHPVYEPALAYLGLQSKLATIVQLFLVWAAVQWALLHVPLPDWLAALLPLVPGVLTWGFVLQDIESIRDHRIRMGARPNRWLDLAIAFLSAIPDKLLAPLLKPPAEEEELKGGEEGRP